MTFKCHCCGKVLKTESGFKKHFCEFQKRFLEIENHGWFNKWLKMKTIFKIKVKKNKNDEYYNIIHSPFYNQFVLFLKWSDENELFDYTSYLEYLKKKNYPMKMWSNLNVYKEFVKEYIKNELPALAMERSQKYLNSINETLNSITPNRLYFALLNGSISNKYIKQKNFDITKVLDKGQLNDIKDLLV